MALSLKHPEADRLVRELCSMTGEKMTEAIIQSLRERIERERRRREADDLVADLMEIAGRCARRPVLDDRTPDEIIGYDENGLPR